MLTLVRRNLRHPLVGVAADFDRLFDRAFGGALLPSVQESTAFRVWDFRVNEGEQEFVVRAELPGFEEKDLDVQLHQDVLTVKAERKEDQDGERQVASYHRSVTLPQGVDV